MGKESRFFWTSNSDSCIILGMRFLTACFGNATKGSPRSRGLWLTGRTSKTCVSAKRTPQLTADFAGTYASGSQKVAGFVGRKNDMAAHGVVGVAPGLLSQQGDGFGEGEVGGEDFAAVVLPVEGAKTGAGEGAFGLARQLDDHIRCQPLVLKTLFRRPHVVGRGYDQDGAVRQLGGRSKEPATKALGADDSGALVVLQCRGKNLGLSRGAAVDEQDQRRGDLEALVADERGVQPRACVLQGDKHRAFHQEEGRGHLRGFERSAGIVAEVENDARCAFTFGED